MQSPKPYLLAYGLLCVLVCTSVAWLPMTVLLGRMIPDDGFYYLQIARNLARTGRQTFDTIHWTNGYHPLWGWLLAAVALPLRYARDETLLRVALFFNAVVYSAAVYVFAHAWHRVLPRTWPLLLLAGAAFFFTTYTWLMETALVILLVGLVLCHIQADASLAQRLSKRHWAYLGVLLALLGLSRLDTIFPAAGLFVVAVAPRMGGGFRGRSFYLPLLTVGVAAAILAPWLLFTRVTSGHWGTISGSLKMHAYVSPPEHSLTRTWFLLDPITRSSAVVSVCWLLLLAMSPRFRASANRGLALMVAFVLGALLHLGFQLAWVPWQGFAWTFTFQRLALLLVTFHLLEWLFATRQAAGRKGPGFVVLVAVALVILWVCQAVIAHARPRAWTYHAFLASRWIQENLPPESVLATKDAGVFGYFAKRPVVNLDGLVNDWSYQEALRTESHVEFLRRAGVTHLVQHNVEDYAIGAPYRFWFYSALYSYEAQPLFLPPGQIVYLSPPFPHGSGKVHVAIWQYP